MWSAAGSEHADRPGPMIPSNEGDSFLYTFVTSVMICASVFVGFASLSMKMISASKGQSPRSAYAGATDPSRRLKCSADVEIATATSRQLNPDPYTDSPSSLNGMITGIRSVVSPTPASAGVSSQSPVPAAHRAATAATSHGRYHRMTSPRRVEDATRSLRSSGRAPEIFHRAPNHATSISTTNAVSVFFPLCQCCQLQL